MDQLTRKQLEDRLILAETRLKEYQAIQDARQRYSSRGLQVTIRELSEANAALANAEKKLQDQNQRLEKMDRLKDQFLAIVSHDLRSPLSNIKGLANLLENELEKQGSPLEKEIVEKIGVTAEYTLELARNLLDLTLIRSGTFNIVPQTANLNDILQKVIDREAISARRKNIDLQARFDSSIEAFSFDPLKMEQVFHNLISNAIKFSHEHTSVKVISQKEVHEKENVCVSVIDQGLGIPESDLPFIFNPYNKVSVKPTGKESSTGLGLSIVCQIVKAHCGNIAVESKVNEGSHFKVLLPIEV